MAEDGGLLELQKLDKDLCPTFFNSASKKTVLRSSAPINLETVKCRHTT